MQYFWVIALETIDFILFSLQSFFQRSPCLTNKLDFLNFIAFRIASSTQKKKLRNWHMARFFITLMIFFCPFFSSFILQLTRGILYLWRELRKVLLRTSSFNNPSLRLSISFYSTEKTTWICDKLFISVTIVTVMNIVTQLLSSACHVDFEDVLENSNTFDWRWENLKKTSE